MFQTKSKDDLRMYINTDRICKNKKGNYNYTILSKNNILNTKL